MGKSKKGMKRKLSPNSVVFEPKAKRRKLNQKQNVRAIIRLISLKEVCKQLNDTNIVSKQWEINSSIPPRFARDYPSTARIRFKIVASAKSKNAIWAALKFEKIDLKLLNKTSKSDESDCVVAVFTKAKKNVIQKERKKLKKKDFTPISGKLIAGTFHLLVGTKPFRPAETVNRQQIALPDFSSMRPLVRAHEYSPRLMWEHPIVDHEHRSYFSYLPCIFDDEETAWWLQTAIQYTPWQQTWIKGQELSRKSAWFVDSSCQCHYGYGKAKWAPVRTPAWLKHIEERVFSALNLPFRPNCCNMNMYSTGNDKLGWHADDEDLFQGTTRDCLIVSLSLGQARTFAVKTRQPGAPSTNKVLAGGDICIMEGFFQKFYLHSVLRDFIPPSLAELPRINFTWRTIVRHQGVDKCPIASCANYEMYRKLPIPNLYLVPRLRLSRARKHPTVHVEFIPDKKEDE